MMTDAVLSSLLDTLLSSPPSSSAAVEALLAIDAGIGSGRWENGKWQRRERERERERERDKK